MLVMDLPAGGLDYEDSDANTGKAIIEPESLGVASNKYNLLAISCGFDLHAILLL